MPSVAQEDDGRILGFCGVQEDSLEMLFVDPAHHGEGVGSALFRFAAEKLGARRLEVNQQNPRARRFYEDRGWFVTGWRETDDAGEPFPLLQMEPPAFSEEELREAQRQIGSMLHKLRKTVETLGAKGHPERYKSQITLAKRRIRTLEIASTLIHRKL